jgi:regulator of nucleoside diphosphate kinase
VHCAADLSNGLRLGHTRDRRTAPGQDPLCPMKTPHQQPIYITPTDRSALFRLLATRQPPHHDVTSLVNLKSELDRAVVVPEEDLPPSVVTIGSRVLIRDVDTGIAGEYTLVFPGSADIRQGMISILAPVGTALLGQQVGDVVDWAVPAGRKRFRIEEVFSDARPPLALAL